MDASRFLRRRAWRLRLVGGLRSWSFRRLRLRGSALQLLARWLAIDVAIHALLALRLGGLSAQYASRVWRRTMGLSCGSGKCQRSE